MMLSLFIFQCMYLRWPALGLEWSAVSFDNNTITIRHTVVNGNGTLHKTDSTKNDSSYAVVPMSKMIIHELKKWKDKQAANKLLQPNDYIDNGYICTHASGNLIKPNYVSQHFSLLLKNNNMPHIRFYDLRHSAASYLLYLGFNLKEIQTWLRHSDFATTDDKKCTTKQMCSNLITVNK